MRFFYTYINILPISGWALVNTILTPYFIVKVFYTITIMVSGRIILLSIGFLSAQNNNSDQSHH